MQRGGGVEAQQLLLLAAGWHQATFMVCHSPGLTTSSGGARRLYRGVNRCRRFLLCTRHRILLCRPAPQQGGRGVVLPLLLLWRICCLHLLPSQDFCGKGVGISAVGCHRQRAGRTHDVQQLGPLVLPLLCCCQLGCAVLQLPSKVGEGIAGARGQDLRSRGRGEGAKERESGGAGVQEKQVGRGGGAAARLIHHILSTPSPLPTL